MTNTINLVIVSVLRTWRHFACRRG